MGTLIVRTPFLAPGILLEQRLRGGPTIGIWIVAIVILIFRSNARVQRLIPHSQGLLTRLHALLRKSFPPIGMIHLIYHDLLLSQVHASMHKGFAIYTTWP